MQNILVPIGSTSSAKNTLQYAIDFAATLQDAKLIVFRAYTGLNKFGAIKNVNAFLERETNLYLKTMLSIVDTKNVDITLATAKGNTVESVIELDEELGIDLIIVGAKSNSFKEELFLGKTAGSLVKQTDIPILTVPENSEFKHPSSILMAFQSGKVEKGAILYPLEFFKQTFSSAVHLLMVKTPDFEESDATIDKKLDALKDSFTQTENATTYQGVLEHLKTVNPDMLCVYRRKRGFFQKLWEKNTILKSEFFVNIPILILKGN